MCNIEACEEFEILTIQEQNRFVVFLFIIVYHRKIIVNETKWNNVVQIIRLQKIESHHIFLYRICSS